MSYLNKLLNNIETVNCLNRVGDGNRTHKELTLKDVDKLNNELSKKAIEALSLLDIDGSSLVSMRYVLSSEDLQRKITSLDESYVSIYKALLNQSDINKLISADELCKYDVEELKVFFDYINSKDEYLNNSKAEIMFKYLEKNSIYNDGNTFIKVFDVINSYDVEGINLDRTMDIHDVLEYALTNGICKMKYQSVKGIMQGELSNIDMEYLSYISNNGIYNIYSEKGSDSKKFIRSLSMDNDFAKRKEILAGIGDILKENFNYLLRVFETRGFTNKELNTFLYKIKNGETFIMFKETHWRVYEELLYFIYPNFKKGNYSNYELEMSHYVLSSGKKKFLTAYNEFKEINEYYRLGVISRGYVYKLLNLNSLSCNDLKDIENSKALRYETRLESYIDRGFSNISLKEFMYILSLPNNHSMIYKRLYDVKVDDRMRLVSDLPAIEDVKDGDYANKVAALIKEKSLTNRINKEYKMIQKVSEKPISKSIWLKYFLIDDLDFMKNQIKTDLDVVFFVNFEEEIRKSTIPKFEEAKKDIYLNSKTYEKFKYTLKASEEYLEDNKENIYEFFLTGMMDIYNTYSESLRSKYRDNLSKITKAEIKGKLKDIKFYDGDLSKEIGYAVSKEQEETWKENIKFKGSSYITEEADDYETIIKLGAIPVRTCMNYIDGSYNYCLLSNFDANKKILLGKSQDGTILGRAILRLTKMSDSKIAVSSGSNDLVFRDIENISEVSKEKESHKEELVLFLEKCYTSANDRDNMELDLVKLAYEKAKKLGVKLMVSGTYRNSSRLDTFKSELQEISKSYIYISKSKNGQQYIDSFSGSTSNNEAGYNNANGFKMFLQPNMLNVAVG